MNKISYTIDPKTGKKQINWKRHAYSGAGSLIGAGAGVLVGGLKGGKELAQIGGGIGALAGYAVGGMLAPKMNKQAALQEIYQSAFNDELEKSAKISNKVTS